MTGDDFEDYNMFKVACLAVKNEFWLLAWGRHNVQRSENAFSYMHLTAEL